MEIDLSKFKWTREPESCVIHDGVIEIVTKPHQTCGRGPTIIFAMTMHRYFR